MNSDSSSAGPDSDRQTHSSHTFNIPHGKTGQAKFQPTGVPPKPPKISPIPRIPPPSPMEPIRPSAASLAQGLEGRYVDEFGNVLDWDGTVLARVEGDLPSMVGRPVSETGEVLDQDGEVVGHVAENFTQQTYTELGGGLKADAEGNIYNQAGNVIGKLNEPPARRASPSQGDGAPPSTAQPPPRHSNAPKPSEVTLDVKSTFDGIQIILKIPTVFNEGGPPTRPSPNYYYDADKVKDSETQTSE